jgi:hypothetical protein
MRSSLNWCCPFGVMNFISFGSLMTTFLPPRLNDSLLLYAFGCVCGQSFFRLPSASGVAVIKRARLAADMFTFELRADAEYDRLRVSLYQMASFDTLTFLLNNVK